MDGKTYLTSVHIFKICNKIEDFRPIWTVLSVQDGYLVVNLLIFHDFKFKHISTYLV